MFLQIDPETSLETNYLGRLEPAQSLALSKGEIVVAADRAELMAYAKMLDIAVGAIEDWEFETRMDVSQVEATQLARMLRAIASPSAPMNSSTG